MRSRIDKSDAGARQRILDAAENRFARTGYSGTSIKQIAQDARVTGAMISYYFGSKEKLLVAVMDRVVRDLETMAGEMIATRKPPVVRLEIYLRWLHDYVGQHPNFARLTAMSRGEARRGHLEKVVKERLRPLYDMGVRFFEDGIARGRFKPVDISGLLSAIYAMVVTNVAERDFLCILQGIDPLAPAELERHKDALVDMVFRILGVRKRT